MKPKIHIPEPCSEDWNKMEIGLRSRFCQSCTKDVMDFTKMSREEILKYLLENRSKQVCGHVLPSQLDFTTSDYITSINTLTTTHKNTNLSFYLLALGTMIIAGYNTNTNAQTPPPSDTISIVKMANDSLKSNPKVCDKGPKNTTLPPSSKVGKLMIEGEIMIEPEGLLGYVEMANDTLPYFEVEKMPEFPGGINALDLFIKKHLNKTEITDTGTVYIQFVVTKTGVIYDFKFYQPEQSTETMKEEAARVLNKMPLWIPGQQHGENVDVYFMLPIEFKKD